MMAVTSKVADIWKISQGANVISNEERELRKL